MPYLTIFQRKAWHWGLRIANPKILGWKTTVGKGGLNAFYLRYLKQKRKISQLRQERIFKVLNLIAVGVAKIQHNDDVEANS